MEKSKLPKRLAHDNKNFPSFIVDENGFEIGIIHAYNSKPQIKQAIIDRYNEHEYLYSQLKVVAWFATIAVLASCALVVYVQSIPKL